MALRETGGHTRRAMATGYGTSQLHGETGAFRVVAFVEAVTYLVLLGASFVKRVLDGTDVVPVVGLVHGLVFLVYLVLVLRIREGQGWRLGRTILVIVASAIPLGGFWAGRELKDADEGM